MRIGYRTRLFLILSLFALVPALVVTVVWGVTVSSLVPLVTEVTAWDSVGASGQRAIAAARRNPLTADQERALRAHEQELTVSVTQARRVRYLARQAVPAALFAAFIGLALLMLISSRVAGHLSRQLSRPLQELVGWADNIARNEPLPEGAPKRGAPEFGLLRARMRRMSREIALGRERAVENERAQTLRETARRVAHELKNPLTPIRFAVARLRRDAPPQLAETVEVLAIESERLERMARSFAQFGKLPEGPPSQVDVGELARYTARSTVPEGVRLEVDVAADTPMIRGHHEPLARALSNVLLNAVDACAGGGEIHVTVAPTTLNGGRPAVRIGVRDTGCGIPPEKLAGIWEPYVTSKPGGTGLGLAIARQTVLAHHGDVGADSAPGRGTEIHFTIPVGDAMTTTTQPPAGE